jgi:alkylated DNA repair dioxygenase AlkB
MMDLFSDENNSFLNLLPYNGEVNYYGCVLSAADANWYFNRLLATVEWKNDEAIVFGKKIITKRKVAWYGDDNFEYTYSNVRKYALPWTEELLLLKQKVEQLTGESYNSCLLNLYHDGSEGMAWHSDGEQDLKKNGAIASLSLGATRKFSFKHKKDHCKIDIILESGSLLVMTGDTQSNWLHRLPPTKKVSKPRINLTFRTIVNHN